MSAPRFGETTDHSITVVAAGAPGSTAAAFLWGAWWMAGSLFVSSVA